MSYFVDIMGGMGNGSGGSNMYGSGMSYQGQSGYRPPMTSRQYWQQMTSQQYWQQSWRLINCFTNVFHSAKSDFMMLW